MTQKNVANNQPFHDGTDDEVVCTNCDWDGLVRAGADECPDCGKETLMWAEDKIKE